MSALFPTTILIVVCLFVSESTCYRIKVPLNTLRSSNQKKTNPNDIWYFMGITRQQFKEEHEKDLTPSVMKKMYGTMNEQLNTLKKYFQYRANSLQLELNKGKNAKRSEDENIEEVVEKDLKQITDSLNIGDGLRHADEFQQPTYVQECLAKIKPDDENTKKKLKYVNCAELIFEKTAEKIASDALDTIESFINKFEDYMWGMTSFVYLFHQYAIETDGSFMKRTLEISLDLDRLLELLKEHHRAVANGLPFRPYLADTQRHK